MKLQILFFMGVVLSFVLGIQICRLNVDCYFREESRFHFDYDRLGMVSCDSNSMGLTLNCNDLLYEKAVTKAEQLIPGLIYIYNATNHTTVHRLVGCVDENCSVAIFKGDNNEIAELVNRSDVLYKVERVEYR